MSSIRNIPAGLLLALGILVAQPAAAQPAGTLGEDFIYRVRPGDTLIGLAGTYTHSADLWRQLQDLNGVADPYRLPIGLELRIPLSLIPRQPAQARIVHVSGTARVSGAPARVGDVVGQGSTVSTGAGGYVALELGDGSTLTVPPGTTLSLDHLHQFRGTALTDTIIRVEEGDLESTVAPSGGGVGRFEIRTPTAVTGVRGTRFRVRSSDQGLQSEVLQGSVRLQPRAGGDEAAGPVVVRDGYGASVRADGSFAGVQRLLPAPEVSAPARAGGQWQASVTPLAGAVAYWVGVSRDPDGHHPVSESVSSGTDLRFSAPGAGTYYVTVRGLDAQGLGGRDTRHRFEGASTLLDARGQAVSTGTGGVVMLTDF